MDDSEDYVRGETTTITTNRGNTIHITLCYAKKEPEGLWDNVFQTLLHMGVFDDML